MKKVWIGTSGYNYRDWRGIFYPEKLPQREWLPFYARQFPTVEINNSFYTTVKAETYSHWYSQTPAQYPFAIKGHRYITQMKKLKEIEEPVKLFFENARALKDKLKVVVWQFPKQFTCKDEEYFDRLEKFLKLLPATVLHTFEFRHESWFGEDVRKLLHEYNACLTLADSGKFPEHEFLTSDFIYIRFHGPTGLYTSKYSDNQLRDWAEKIKEWRKTKEVYCYFNNDWYGNAIENARTLEKLLI